MVCNFPELSVLSGKLAETHTPRGPAFPGWITNQRAFQRRIHIDSDASLVMLGRMVAPGA
jgi:hypothetical protein